MTINSEQIDNALENFRSAESKYYEILNNDELSQEGKDSEIKKLHNSLAEMKKTVDSNYQEELRKAQETIEVLSEVEAFPKVDAASVAALTYQANVIESRFSMNATTVEGFKQFVKDILVSQPEARQAFLDIAHKLKPAAEASGIGLIRFDEAYREISNSLKSDDQLSREKKIDEISKQRMNLGSKYHALSRNADQIIGEIGRNLWGKESYDKNVW